MNHRTTRRLSAALVAALALAAAPRQADAQLDPLLFLKKPSTPAASAKPTVLIGIETTNRMLYDTNGDYRDNNWYVRLGQSFEGPLGVTATNTARNYRRKFVGLYQTDPNTNSGDKFSADRIETVGDRDPRFGTFDDHTRLSVARRSLREAVERNAAVARFGLIKTRQKNPRYLAKGTSTDADKWLINEEPVVTRNRTAQWDPQYGTKWRITRPVVDGTNSSVPGPVAPLVGATAADTVTSVVDILKAKTGGDPTGVVDPLLPAGTDGQNRWDAPLDNLLDDIRAHAETLLATPECRNTVAVLVVGGGEGAVSGENPVDKAKTFLSVSGHRVPIYVAGLAPLTDSERTQLRSIAAESGGQFVEITAAMVGAVPPGQPVPELVKLVNLAVSHTFASPADFDKAPSGIAYPYGSFTDFQTTSPIIGTVNLENAVDIDGYALPDTIIKHPVTGEKVPQRSNVLITAGFSLPGFDGRLKAMRVYRPVVDGSKSIGHKFVSDGTRLWVASAPDAAVRNIYTTLPDGTMVAFKGDSWSALKNYLRTTDETSTRALIEAVRSQPLGAIVGSTPALLDAPSLDPPPDAAYPGFADANKNRRSLIWVGANDGMLHAIDGRLGKEVWAFIPFNLLPKLQTLLSGQPTGDFRYFMDGSAKVADVKVAGQWRTYLVIGQGSGGTFYQTFDVTLDNMAASVSQSSDDLNAVLGYFALPTRVPLKWAFPQYSQFDWTLGTNAITHPHTPWGDVAAGAPEIAKTVGETWSDPAVGQIESPSSKFAVLTGSGYFRYSAQQQSNRGGKVAGTTFYLLDIETGDVLDSKDVGNDNKGETNDYCVSRPPGPVPSYTINYANDCRQVKNALQADPVATGPADSRFISKVYMGDLDGRIMRFDVGLGTTGLPAIKALVTLYTGDSSVGTAAQHPIFSSMATVNVGATLQYLFVGTGSDLLPQNGVSHAYALLVVQDLGSTGKLTGVIKLETTDGLNGDEKVSAFPAVAGDIVFFTTTTYRSGACALPDANLYGFTFIGGPAYDTNGDGKVTTGTSTAADAPKIRTAAGSRATAPFIVDQHLVFGTGNKIEMFGDPQDFNNGVGQAGVRILSWREVR